MKTYKNLVSEYGIPAGASEFVRRLTAHNRHEERVKAAEEAALDYVRYVTGGESRERAVAILYADCMGLGGPRGLMGEATVRHPALSGLGKGRKQATDGGAWSEAILRAAYNLGQPPLTFLVREGRLGIGREEETEWWEVEEVLGVAWSWVVVALGVVVALVKLSEKDPMLAPTPYFVERVDSFTLWYSQREALGEWLLLFERMEEEKKEAEARREARMASVIEDPSLRQAAWTADLFPPPPSQTDDLAASGVFYEDTRCDE